ncbi:hypothetical protein INS49_007723 [Diaporthe citri]|uniref:uncharacterized protein n=1 Tax=Diaporthe citri TaxID=83186 RepID=UPI001C822A39|nr:uncharacterized protein INS49_007723 [Diaporthe citri]KAG6362631.1 hypothetical protein INS49_007723 [Diaporthe citri]
MASEDRTGMSWCDNCGKWKADKAFVRARFKRGTKLWERYGFVWKKYKTCNRCSRVYYRKPEMPVAEFVGAYGAEEHNDSEPDLDDDDDNEEVETEEEGS